MKPSPDCLGLIHFIGIGGIGMSGIAKVLHAMGYHVQGSDQARNLQTQHLEELGITVYASHRPEHLEHVRMVVISTAIRPDNPELQEARRRHLPVIRRAEMLGELMRLKHSIAISGTHGKTTTTSLVGALLEHGGCDPTIINGGIINAYGSNARPGTGPWIVVEADESDGSLKHLPGTLVAVTNINPEHLDYYGSVEALKAAFHHFVSSIPFYGLAMLCWDHPEVRDLARNIVERRVVTYGLEEGAQIQAVHVQALPQGMAFDVHLDATLVPHEWLDHPSISKINDTRIALSGLSVSMMGRHNVQNALVAVVVACELGIALETLKSTLQEFQGVKRRFSIVGEFQGATIVDDYAHHPVEIHAVFDAARQRNPETRLIAVWQPHRYSRVQRLLQDFTHVLPQADHVIVLPVYGAGETHVPSITSDFLAQALQRPQGATIHGAQGVLDLAQTLYGLIRPGDTVLCLGAGDITYYAAQLPEALAEVHRAQTSVSLEEAS